MKYPIAEHEKWLAEINREGLCDCSEHGEDLLAEVKRLNKALEADAVIAMEMSRRFKELVKTLNDSRNEYIKLTAERDRYKQALADIYDVFPLDILKALRGEE